MEKPTNQSIKKILQTSSLMQEYISKTKSLEQLTKIIRLYLEPELAKNCSVANFSNNVLILATTSPTWNHKLRFLIPDLLSQLRNLSPFNGLIKIKIIQEFTTYTNRQQTKQVKTYPLSKTSAKHITEIAEHITNKSLVEALLKIARKTQ
jgi:hypothetical protein